MSDWWTQVAGDATRSPIVAAWFAGLAAVTAALVGALVSYLVARRSVYINSVTAERSKWIEALRQTISKFSGAAGRISARRRQGEYSPTQDWAEDTEKLRVLLADLTLRLNPTEVEAGNLLRAARKVDAAARIHSPSALILADEIMIRHAQWVLKAEWEQVKREASGFLQGPQFWVRRRRRAKEYREFLLRDGDLSRLNAIGAGTGDVDLIRLRSQMDR